MYSSMIDRIREQIQQRLDQLVGEADKLRKALAALGPHSSTASADSAPAGKAAAPKRSRSATPRSEPATTNSAPARRTRQPAAASRRRTPPGATKAAVLGALSTGEAMTAGQVAEKTGLPRNTVATTLTRLAKSGEVQKAEHGYRLAPTGESAASATPASAATTE
jgi:CRP-like cAMP-binding protein